MLTADAKRYVAIYVAICFLLQHVSLVKVGARRGKSTFFIERKAAVPNAIRRAFGTPPGSETMRGSTASSGCTGAITGYLCLRIFERDNSEGQRRTGIHWWGIPPFLCGRQSLHVCVPRQSLGTSMRSLYAFPENEYSEFSICSMRLSTVPD